MRGPEVFKKLIVPAVLVFLALSAYVFLRQINFDMQKERSRYFQEGFKKFLGQPAFSDKISAFFQKELKKEKSKDIRAEEAASLFFIDLVLSLGCLWLSLFFTAGYGTPPAKQYLWFLFILNLSWFIGMLILKAVWGILNFLVIRLEPNLAGVLLHNFSLTAAITSGLVYIWLIARTFSLNFFASLKVALILHLFYFIIIFLTIGFIEPKENRGLNLLKENLGIGAVIDCYISDIRKITSKIPLLSLIRFRAFHL